jgi:hypothetical protein
LVDRLLAGWLAAAGRSGAGRSPPRPSPAGAGGRRCP